MEWLSSVLFVLCETVVRLVTFIKRLPGGSKREKRSIFLTSPGFHFLQGQYSHLVLLAAFDCIDDTKLVKQIIVSVSNSDDLAYTLN